MTCKCHCCWEGNRRNLNRPFHRAEEPRPSASHVPPRGVHDLWMDGGGSAARFSERYPLLITETCGHTQFYDEFWLKTTHFLLFFANFWITHPCLWKICRKMEPCLGNLGPKNPPIWAAHTRTLNMLFTPRGTPLGVTHLRKEMEINKCDIPHGILSAKTN